MHYPRCSFVSLPLSLYTSLSCYSYSISDPLSPFSSTSHALSFSFLLFTLLLPLHSHSRILSFLLTTFISLCFLSCHFHPLFIIFNYSVFEQFAVGGGLVKLDVNYLISEFKGLSRKYGSGLFQVRTVCTLPYIRRTLVLLCLLYHHLQVLLVLVVGGSMRCLSGIIRFIYD